MIKQLNLNLRPIKGLEKQTIPSSVHAAIRSLSDCMYFDFPGPNKLNSRPGQFQYRYGKKVQPKDWRIKK